MGSRPEANKERKHFAKPQAAVATLPISITAMVTVFKRLFACPEYGMERYSVKPASSEQS